MSPTTFFVAAAAALVVGNAASAAEPIKFDGCVHGSQPTLPPLWLLLAATECGMRGRF